MSNCIKNIFSLLKHIVYVFLVLSVFTLPLIAEENTGKTPTEDTSKEKKDTDKDKDKSKNNNLASSFNGIFNTFLSDALNDMKNGLFNGNKQFRGVCFNGNGSKYVSDTELREKINNIDSWFFGVDKTEKIQNNIADIGEMAAGMAECGGIPIVNGLCLDCVGLWPLFGRKPKPRFSYYLPFHKVEATEYMAHTGYEEEPYITSKMKTWGINRIDDISYLRDIHKQTKTKLQEVGICTNGMCRLQAQKILKPSTFVQVTDNDLLKNTPTTNSSGVSTNIFTRVFPTGYHEFFTNQQDWGNDNIELNKATQNIGYDVKNWQESLVNTANGKGTLVNEFSESLKGTNLMKGFSSKNLLKGFSSIFDKVWGHDGANYAERKEVCLLAFRDRCKSAKSNRKGLVKDGNGEHGLFYEAYGSRDENGHDYLESANPKVRQINNAISFVKSSSGIPGKFPKIETGVPQIDEANEKGFIQTGVCTESYTDFVDGIKAKKCFNPSAQGSNNLNAAAKGPLVAYYRTSNHLEAAFKSVYRAMTWANAIEDSSNNDNGSIEDDCNKKSRKIFHPFFNESLEKVTINPSLPSLILRKRSKLQLLKNNSRRYEKIGGCSSYSDQDEFVPSSNLYKTLNRALKKGGQNSDKEIFPDPEGKAPINHGRTTVVAIWNYLSNCTLDEDGHPYFTPFVNGIWY